MIFSDANNERMMFKEIKINNHSVMSPEEIVQKFKDYFTSTYPSLAEKIDNNECDYSQFVNRVESSSFFKSINYSRLLGSIKYQPKF